MRKHYLIHNFLKVLFLIGFSISVFVEILNPHSFLSSTDGLVRISFLFVVLVTWLVALRVKKIPLFCGVLLS